MNSSLVAHKTLTDLGPGAQIATFGFRACAFGQTRCCCLLNLFKDFFGAEIGGPVLGRFIRLAECLGNNGLRRIDLTVPNAITFTHDEASLLSALSSMQHGAFAQARAHMTWLLARSPQSDEMNIISDLANFFSAQDMIVQSPEYESMPAQRETDKRPALALVQNV
ncbi:MAG: hypothetical protein HRT81_03875 [Henriciella sp.]|nr:hypothetical protein [Henriciella sp.]